MDRSGNRRGPAGASGHAPPRTSASAQRRVNERVPLRLGCCGYDPTLVDVHVSPRSRRIARLIMASLVVGIAVASIVLLLVV